MSLGICMPTFISPSTTNEKPRNTTAEDICPPVCLVPSDSGLSGFQRCPRIQWLMKLTIIFSSKSSKLHQSYTITKNYFESQLSELSQLSAIRTLDPHQLGVPLGFCCLCWTFAIEVRLWTWFGLLQMASHCRLTWIEGKQHVNVVV